MSKLWKYRNLLGLTDVRRMTGAGWRFCEGGVRTFDAWAVWAAEPEGDMKLVWLADPEIYPDAWPDEQLHQEQSPQLELFAVVIAAGDAITTERPDHDRMTEQVVILSVSTAPAFTASLRFRRVRS